VARLDLGWPEHRVGLEYDGAVHRERRQHSRDLDRHNAIRTAGWTVLQVDQRILDRAGDLLARLALLVPPS
jgi:very-short-patch-repair endonuclease